MVDHASPVQKPEVREAEPSPQTFASPARVPQTMRGCLGRVFVGSLAVSRRLSHLATNVFEMRDNMS